MKQYELFELSFDMKEPKKLAKPRLKAVFTHSEGEVEVKGFYRDGKAVFRFLPEHVGEYKWQITGELSASGSESCERSQNAKGPVRAVGTHFEYANGEKFLPFGTTVYALAHQTPELVEQTLQTLSTAPFNKVRMCLFPKSYDYNQNDPQFYPFEKKKNGKWDVNRPNEAYWENIEQILTRLNSMGIQADIILFHPYDRWGFATLKTSECHVFLDTAIRRIAAFPNVWWSLANEYDLMFARTMHSWHSFERFITKNDPFGHLLSNHNCFKPYDYSRKRITHVCIQSRYTARTQSLIKKFGKPVIFDECAYEGNLPFTWGNITGKEMVNRFWTCVASGGYCTHGEVFLDENDVLWWAKGGVLKGESPERIAFLRSIVDELPAPLEQFTLRQEIPEDMANNFKLAAKANILALICGLLRMASTVGSKVGMNQLTDEASWRTSRCGDDVFLCYFGRTCPGITTIPLPEDKSYRIEIIDAWEMTRSALPENASGKTTIELPSKECIAVLATAVK